MKKCGVFRDALCIVFARWSSAMRSLVIRCGAQTESETDDYREDASVRRQPLLRIEESARVHNRSIISLMQQESSIRH